MNRFNRFCAAYGRAQVKTPLAPPFMRRLQKNNPEDFGKMCLYVLVFSFAGMLFWIKASEDDFGSTLASQPEPVTPTLRTVVDEPNVYYR